MKITSKLTLFVFILLFVSCSKDDPKPGVSKKENDTKFFLFEVNERQDIVTRDVNDPEIPIKSTVRFLLRGTLDSNTIAGNWAINGQMFVYMDMKENADDDDIEGYMSGEIHWNTFELEVIKLDLGIVDPTGGNFTTFFQSYYDGTPMPTFYSTPGKFDYTVFSEDGTPFNFTGSQLFLTGWPEKIYLQLGGNKGEDNCDMVRLHFTMADEGGISVTDVTLEGKLMKFNNLRERDDWIVANAFPDYFANPELIIQ